MGKIKNPLQFSHHFGISPARLSSLGVLDHTPNVDARLFIDPLLFKSSKHSEMQEADGAYKKFFADVIKLLVAAKAENDIAWRAAYKKLLFREIKGTCLGYGAASIHGRGPGPKLARRLTATAKEIVDLGVRDPDLFLSLPLLEEDVGPDLISDMATSIILPDLVRFNERVQGALKVPREKFEFNGLDASLAVNPLETTRVPVLLVPKDVLRDLPIANDWEDVCRAAQETAELRSKVNKLIGEIWEAKTRKDKKAIRENVLASYEAFNTLLQTIHQTVPSSYDFESDPEGFLVWRRIHETVAKEFPLLLKAPKSLDLKQADEVVSQIIAQFQHLIEKRGLSKELWHDGKRRNEKSVQRLFFAVADSYCKANNLDISPEVDTGTGEVDFKFSHGYTSRVLVEIKLSDNPKVVGGYERQLETYKKAEHTMRATYVVIDVGKMGKKDKEILKLQGVRKKEGFPASEIVFIDGFVKASASKL
ncbi:MAG: hypothetical protein E8D48_08060 [Nitrospira sp.]|nr:MAG: hypothetical protein E8D48_08060 [Nitrospira sp.]